MLAGTCWYGAALIVIRNQVLVSLVQVLGRVCIGVLMAGGLENVFRLFCRVLRTQRMSQLHLCILQNLLFQIVYLALFMTATCGAFNRAQRAIVLVTGADSHVVETAVVSDACDADFDWTLRYLHLCRTCIIILLTLVDSIVVLSDGGLLVTTASCATGAFFITVRRLDG